MLNFDTELDRQGVAKIIKVATEVGVESRVESRPIRQRSERATHILVSDGEWTWRELRDYVVAEIEFRFGSIPGRTPIKEQGIFKSFLNRHDRAVDIARYVFEERDGVWERKPVTLFSFCKGSDPFFAVPINERLMQPEIAAW